MTPQLLASLEQLENYQPFLDFCQKLESDWTETIKKKMRDGEKIVSEDYARAKIYCSLPDMPRKIRLALTPIEKAPEKKIYE